jgi:hypothetical protein
MTGVTMATNPLLAALAESRRRAAPMFTKWCELNGISACPVLPAAVARFVSDCAALGIERLWPAVQEISKMHVEFGYADPTLGDLVAAAIDKIACIPPPRSWPNDSKLRFKSLPYDLQVYVAAHEQRREKAIRRAQNDASIARQQLASYQQTQGVPADDPKIQKVEINERDHRANS